MTHVGFHDVPDGVTFHTDNPETTFAVRTADSEYKYRPLQDGSAVITGWEPLDAKPDIVQVPAEVNGHPVRTLGDNVFNTSEGWIETSFRLVIPEGIVDCEGDPFMCCHDAKEILLPSTFVGDLTGCFYHVGADITVAAGNPAYRTEDGYLIDTRTDTLIYTAVMADEPLPEVRRIGHSALQNWGLACYRDEEDWPDIGEGLTLTIPEGVESVGSAVLYDNIAVSRVALPDSLTQLAPHAFYGVGLTEIVFGTGLTSLAEGSCYGAGEGFMTEATLPETITFVGYQAFCEDVTVTPLNPDCHFETEEEYLLRMGDEAWDW